MNLRISFLICQIEKNNEPFIFFKKNEKGNYELPTFEMPESDYDVDNFVNSKFKELTNVNPIDKNGFGWINLFLAGTIVFDEKYSFIYMCKVPELINIENYEKIKMSTLLNSETFDQDYISQVLYSFNSLYVK
jgi:hypothetical protein